MVKIVISPPQASVDDQLTYGSFQQGECPGGDWPYQPAELTKCASVIPDQCPLWSYSVQQMTKLKPNKSGRYHPEPNLARSGWSPPFIPKLQQAYPKLSSSRHWSVNYAEDLFPSLEDQANFPITQVNWAKTGAPQQECHYQLSALSPDLIKQWLAEEGWSQNLSQVIMPQICSQEHNNQSVLLPGPGAVNQLCQRWLEEAQPSSELVEQTMKQYCQSYPHRTECQCLNREQHPVYQQISQRLTNQSPTWFKPCSQPGTYLVPPDLRQPTSSETYQTIVEIARQNKLPLTQMTSVTEPTWISKGAPLEPAKSETKLTQQVVSAGPPAPATVSFQDYIWYIILGLVALIVIVILVVYWVYYREERNKQDFLIAYQTAPRVPA